MSDFQSQERRQEQKREDFSFGTPNGLRCPKCKTLNEKGAKFCEECGSVLHLSCCPQCGAELIPGADICEECGTYILKGRCSFCGSPMAEQDPFCMECGSPSEGVKCGNCGEISHFDFCSHCHAALTERAQEALQEAQSDPVFIQVRDLSEEIEELERGFKKQIDKDEDKIEEKRESDSEIEKRLEMQKKIEALYYKDLKKKNPKGVEFSKEEERKKPRLTLMSEQEREQLANRFDPEKQRALIEEKKKELQERLDNLGNQDFPDPQTARNFFMARKPQKGNYVWRCNFADEIHPNPDNCGKPQKGGNWVVKFGDINWVPHDGSC